MCFPVNINISRWELRVQERFYARFFYSQQRWRRSDTKSGCCSTHTHLICLNNKHIHGGISPSFALWWVRAGRGGRLGGRRGGIRGHVMSNFPANSSARLTVHLSAQPISGGAALEVQPPDFNRLKCKPVSGAVRKQIENIVRLVPQRTRRFSPRRFGTEDTLDAGPDPRRRHEPDTVFVICGLNTMGEFHCWTRFPFFFLLVLDAANGPTTWWERRADSRCVLSWRLRPDGR